MHLPPYSNRESIADLNEVFCPWPIHEIDKAGAAPTVFPGQGRFAIVSIFHGRTVTPIVLSLINRVVVE